jgi:hypothetical protein
MRRQIMASNAHWNPRIERATDRLKEADAKLTEAIYIDLRPQPWFRRINWFLVGVVVFAVGLDVGCVFLLIWLCEALQRPLQRFLEGI